MTSQLDAISQIANNNPDSALTILKKYEKEKAHWSKGDRMYYELVRLKAENKSMAVFSTDTVINDVVDYFKDHGTANERMLAYYLQGRVYADMGEAPQALQAYYDAIESADTTSSDCDYQVLIPVYGQMSQLFHQQNLPHDEIWALQHYIEYIRRYNSEKEYVIEKRHMISPYYLLGKKDTVLQIINDTYKALKAMGESQEAACALVSSIYIYIEKGQLDKARRNMEIFEKESGMFDTVGNITKGRESYYITKGFYNLAIHQVDSAEKYFRKAMKYNDASDAYKGLLAVYQEKKNIDSVLHYSVLNERSLDSLHNHMEIDAIHKMSSLYNYSRIQKIADLDAQQVRRERSYVFMFLVIGVLGIIISVQLYIRYKKKKQIEIKILSANLVAAQEEYKTIQGELQQLKEKNYSSLIVEKETRIQELKQYIENHTSVPELTAASDNLSDFENSKIVDVFRKKKGYSTSKAMPNKAEWRLLEIQFCKDMPATYKVLAKDKKLSPLEFHVCILLLLGFEDSSIVNLTNSIPQTVSNAKSRANKKIFDEKRAKTLRANLLRMVKHI